MQSLSRQNATSEQTGQWLAGMLAALLMALPFSAFAESTLHHGIWCTAKADDGSCVLVYEMLPDNSFAAYRINTETQQRFDFFGKWIEQPGKACFVREAWVLVDLAENVTLRTGKSDMTSFYCNDIVEADAEKLVVTSPTSHELITATRLDELPAWARQ